MKKIKNLILKKEDITIYILSILYSFFLLIGFSYQLKGSCILIYDGIINIFISLLCLFFLFIIFKVLLGIIYRYLDSIKNNRDNKKKSKFLQLFENHPFIFSLCIMLLCWLPYIISFFPAILSPDPSFQIKQFFGIDNKYSTYVNLIDPNMIITNHHPLIHTLLLGNCLKIGHIIGSDNLGLFLYSLIQISVLSSVLSYTIKYMKKINISCRLRLFFLGIYSLVPMFPFYSMSAVKDVIFSSLVILYIIFIYDMLKNKDKLIKISLIIKVIFLMILIVLFRNNGIYMIFLSFPFLILCNKKNLKKLLLIFITVLLFNYTYNNVILPYFRVTPGSIREMLSIPFQQTARFVKYDYDKLSKSDIDKIDKVLDISDLKERYKPNISDPVKNKFNKDASSEDLKEYFKVWLNGLIKDPLLYIDATMNNVYGYVYPFTSNWYIYSKYNSTINEDGFNYHYNDLEVERKLLNVYGVTFPYIPIIGLISNIAFNVWILFFFCGYMVYKKKKDGIVFLLPGLVLFLVCIASPVNTYFRYAMPFIFGMPITICLVLSYVNDKGVNYGKRK